MHQQERLFTKGSAATIIQTLMYLHWIWIQSDVCANIMSKKFAQNPHTNKYTHTHTQNELVNLG